MDCPDDQSTSESSVWTFFLGPKRVKQTIHSELARHVSPELDKFVKEKSVVKDSKLGSGSVVTLEEFDAETFAAFWAYTYRGDYKAPKAPVPQEEKARRGTLDSAFSPSSRTWRGGYRSDSMSSGVPPPAPSPPPESVQSVTSVSRSSRYQIEPQHQLQIQAQPAESVTEPVSEAKSVIEEPLAPTPVDTPAEDTPAGPEDNGPNNEAVEPVEANAEPDAEAEPVPVTETDPWDESKDDGKGKKSKKGKKKGKKNQPEPVEETPINFTPPSTPPPEAQTDSNEAPFDAIAPEQSTGTDQADWRGEPTAPTEPEPAPAPPAEPFSVPEPEQPTEEREQAKEHNADSSAPSPAHWETDITDEQPPIPQPQPPTKPSIDMSFAKQSQTEATPHTPDLSLWDSFALLEYNDETQAPRAPSPAQEVPYLTFHAKVYVFATRFLIPSLAQLCLRKLHADLLSLVLEDGESTHTTPVSDDDQLAMRQAPMVLDLLRYAYTYTERLEPISETVATQVRENELRRLVVHYAACKLKALARYRVPGELDSGAGTPGRGMDGKGERVVEGGLPRNLRVLLDRTPELASDVVYRMM
ncbi:hypothetical protein N7466_003190 [Penicillium verhagenii]|uniref:uncharacterized protein n=1 Tax=Penicillium verhagenii TaxID=1562060 RepID=UPI0025453DA7|nr:uncharacterized protein N7466_003190 [Penicillium verhagenii]KAJ5936740.1 hypothetical protein N7466_003190 [Penicillium verhagenii]